MFRLSKVSVGLLFFLTIALFSQFLFSEETSPQVLIGKIRIHSKNVFDTGTHLDHQFPYNIANKIHLITRERFIQNEILFKSGDPLDPEIILESERILRLHSMFRNVTVTVLPAVSGVSDIVIETEDVWTTTVQLAYGSAGGKNFYRLGFLERNFLGMGKEVGGFVRKDIDRVVRGVTFYDPQLFGTHGEFFSGYGKDQKGVEWEVRAANPFYSRSTKNSEGVSVSVREDEDRLFKNGEEVAAFQHHTVMRSVFVARSLSKDLQKTRRVSLSHEFKDDHFAEARTGIRPPDHKLSSVLIGFERKDNRFIKGKGLFTFDRIEDVNLGWRIDGKFGPSLKSIHASQDGAVGRFEIDKDDFLGENFYSFFKIKADSRYEKSDLRNGKLIFQHIGLFSNWGNQNTTSLRSEYSLIRNMDPENQLLLGGENGLRGYSVRQLSGNKKVLFSLENRQVLVCDWLNLISFGWAIFADTGGTWGRGESPQFKDFKNDVGAGLRFSPSRSFDPGLIRLDVAYALNENRRPNRWVINIGANLTFGSGEDKKFDQ